MLKQSAYLYSNRQDLYSDLDARNVGYRKMYARTMNLYKGIDNTFEIRLLNGDQKLLNVVGQTLYWILLERDTATQIYQTSLVVDGSFNSLVKFTITEADLDPIRSGKYMYSAYLVDDIGKRTILYGDSQYNATVPVEVIANAFPQSYPTQEITQFFTSQDLNYVQPDTSLYTSAINASPELNSNTALHTATFYSNNFIGSVDIEATLENGVTDIIQWATITNITISDSINFLNFEGVYNWVRFRVKPDVSNTGTVDKILYRS